jgi:NitT/TauT family transport system ATP-binding protein
MTENNYFAQDFQPTLPVEAKPESSTSKAVSITGLKQVFNEGKDDEYRLFDNFNLEIEDVPGKSEIVSIMGSSGCGKSQLLRMIAGLSKPQEGDIRIYSKTIEEYGSIPMVFQAYSNYEWMTVLENVMLPMLIRGVDKKEAREKAMRWIQLVGLEEHTNKYAKSSVLSGGQLQRVSIARSLACDSKVILLDEATGALDIKMKREVQNIILKIINESEKTILNVTHSVEEAVYLSTKAVILLPKPCRIYKTMDIRFDGEPPRDKWIFGTSQFVEYSKELTSALEEVCM